MTFNAHDGTCLCLIGEAPNHPQVKKLLKHMHPKARKIGEALIYPKRKHPKFAVETAKAILENIKACRARDKYYRQERERLLHICNCRHELRSE